MSTCFGSDRMKAARLAGSHRVMARDERPNLLHVRLILKSRRSSHLARPSVFRADLVVTSGQNSQKKDVSEIELLEAPDWPRANA